MRLVITLLVSDENDTIAPWLEYHLAQGAAFVVVTANNASPATVAAVDRYVRAGQARMIEESSNNWDQSTWVTRMARIAACEHEADWIINADADEFFVPVNGTLKDVFMAIPDEYHVLRMPMSDMRPGPESKRPFFERMVIRESFTRKPTRKFGEQEKVAHRAAADVVVHGGNHRVTREGFVEVPAWRPIRILHYPMRSYAQYERKIVRGGEATRRSTIHAGAVRTLRYGDYLEGRLPAFWARHVVGGGDLVEGVREGRLVADERVKHFMREILGAHLSPQVAPDPKLHEANQRAWPELSPQAADLRADLMRRRMAWELGTTRHEQLSAQVRVERLETKIKRLAERIAKKEALHRKVADRLEAAEAGPARRGARGMRRVSRRLIRRALRR